MSASTALPVFRSASARAFFLITAAVTISIQFWLSHLSAREIGKLASIFSTLLERYDAPAAMALLAVLVIAVFVPCRPLMEIPRWMGRHPLRIAGCSAIVMCLGTQFVYRAHPLSMDEYAAYFQSQVFAAGRLSGQFPPQLLDWLIPKPFQDLFLNVSTITGHVASTYWPSFALLLTPFTWLGISWACNPIISALTVVAIHRLTLRLFEDTEAAGLAVLFTIASPVFFANGISYYSMPAHLLANTLYALLLIQPTNGRVVAAGLLGSIALTLHNPAPHLLFAVPWVVWLAARTRSIRLLCYLALGYLPLSLLLGVGWLWYSSNLVTGGNADPSAQAGALGVVSGNIPLFGPPDGGVWLARGLGLAKVWLWAVPGLVVLAILGGIKCRQDSRCLTLIASAFVTLIGYLYVHADQGHGWGFRYFHSVWMILPVLAAGALARSPSAPQRELETSETDLRAFVVACALLTLVAGVGLRTAQMHQFIADDLRQVPAYTGTERRIVILDGSLAYYGADLVQNDPWLRGNVIRMYSHGPAEDAKMMAQYFPQMRLVSRSPYGSVWSSTPTGFRYPAPLTSREHLMRTSRPGQ
jgi:hypothetical protein